jgi:hypothetical protein
MDAASQLPAKRKRSDIDGGGPSLPDAALLTGGGEALTATAPGLAAPLDPPTEVLLSGHDDPGLAEQYALWRERLFTDVWLQIGHPGVPEGACVPGSRLLLASLSPYIKKLLLGSQQLQGLVGDTIFVDVPGGEHALPLVVEVRDCFAVSAGPPW